MHENNHTDGKFIIKNYNKKTHKMIIEEELEDHFLKFKEIFGCHIYVYYDSKEIHMTVYDTSKSNSVVKRISTELENVVKRMETIYTELKISSQFVPYYKWLIEIKMS